MWRPVLTQFVDTRVDCASDEATGNVENLFDRVGFIDDIWEGTATVDEVQEARVAGFDAVDTGCRRQ